MRLTKSGKIPLRNRDYDDSVASRDTEDARGPWSVIDAVGYDELRVIAGRIARSGRVPEHDATSLLHHAISNLAQRGGVRGRMDREAAIASMVVVIRNAAIDRARTRGRASAPRCVDPGLLDSVPADSTGLDRETIGSLADAADELRCRAPRQATALELRIHGGLELQEVATALGISLAQAKRDIAAAKAFFRERLEREGRDR
jgi:DNA-directed RNA polymerase specialized sigma24 family protein